MSASTSSSFITTDDPQWAESLARAHHDVYNTAEFVRLEARLIGARPVAFLVTDGDRIFQVPLLLRTVPLGDGSMLDAVSPYGYPGIVLSDAARSSDGFLADCVTTLRGALSELSVCSAFVRLHPLLNDDFPELLPSKLLSASGMTVSMDLRLSEAEIWARMSKGHTNAINKARRAGFQIEIGRVHEFFDQFALVYRETMQRLGAAPSYDFETEHLDRLASLDEAHIAVASLEGEVAGAYLYFECGQIVQMHLGGTRSAYMRPSPSHLLIHSVALGAKQRGRCTLHLGGGVGGSDMDSLFRFKAGFSPRRHRYFTMRIVTNDQAYCELVHERAKQLNCAAESLLETGFFPAYRETFAHDV